MGSSSVGRGQRIRGPQNLSRAKTAVHQMMQINSDKEKGSKRDPRESMFRGQQEMTRKEKRKQTRKMRKAHINAFHTKTLVAMGDDKVGGHCIPGSLQGNHDVPGKNREKNKRKKRNRQIKFKEEQEAAKRVEELASANKEDVRTIRRLEKDMHFRKNKKTKSTITPSIFKAEGLDYLLDLVNSDSEDVHRRITDDGDLEGEVDSDGDTDGDSDDEDDRPTSVSVERKPGITGTHQKHGTSESEDDEGSASDEGDSDEGDSDEGDSDEGDSDEGDSDEGDSDDIEDRLDSDADADTADTKQQGQRTRNPTKRKHSQNDNSPEDGHKNEDNLSTATSKTSPQPKMDPYGNVIGEENVKKTGSYVPPQKRAKMIGIDGKKQEQLDRLRKQLKGLFNRLSESNIQSISRQIEELYLTNSRNDMHEMLTQLMLDSCIGLMLTGERLVMEHVMLIAVLNINIGIEVGAHFIETLACKLDELYKQGGNYGDGKQCDNIVLLFTHLYNFKVVHCTLVYDIVRKLVDGFTERDIEMLLLILKNAGLMLRKDDPSALKEIITQIQSKATTCSEEFQQQSRVKFMLGTIYAIRNNNVRKIPNYDPAQLDHMRKILRSLIKAKGHTDSDATLRISLENLLSAEDKGRWWIVGSSWAGNAPITAQQDNPSSNEKGELAASDKTSNVITELSRQQRMNTDLRKAIFGVVMTAEDYLDAYEKVLHLSLKGGQEREVIHVIINCCLQEATFNPYYAHLGNKLCQHDRKYKMAFQFAFWDKFKILSEMSSSNHGNLAHLLGQMLVSKALSISILKVIEFADIDKLTVRFLRQTLRCLLLSPSQDAVMAVFGTLTPLPKLQFFREGLRLFLLHFVLPKSDKRQNADTQVELKLRERVELANQTIAGEDHSTKF